MRVRGATRWGQFGWMVLGSVVGGCATMFASVLFFNDNPALGFGWAVIFLIFVVPVSAALALVAFAGYLPGSALARRWELRESLDLACGGAAALLLGGALIATVVLVEPYSRPYAPGALIGLVTAVVFVTLARLPLDQRYERTTDWDAPADE